ncbi:hypothetical protein [Pseudomonas sp. S9]|nr:hypothetical protein [Pseudomonas sp. S9]
MNKQKGFIRITTGEMLFICSVIGAIGWAVISGLGWILSHLTIGWAW